MEQSKIKIQLGSKDVMNLLGGEGEASLEIRNHIVQEFTRRHLKALLNSDVMAMLSKMIKDEARSLITEQVGTIDWHGRATLDVRLREKMIEHVNRHVQDTLDTAIKVAWTSVESKIEAMVQQRFESMTANYIAIQVDKKFKALVDQIKAS